MSELNQMTVAPLGYLKIFFRRKWLLLIPVFAGLILGICAGILLPKKYMSSTIILVEEGKTDNPLFDNLTVSTTIIQRINTIRESMLSWTSLAELVKRLHLDKNTKSQLDFEKLILGIQKNIIIKPRAQNIIDFSYIAKDPEEAQAVVKNTTDIFIEKNIATQNKETTDAIKFIEEQLRVYKGKIMSAEIAELQDQLNTLLLDSTEKHPMVQQLRGQIANKKEDLRKQNLEYTPGDTLKTETTNPVISQIKKTLDTMQPAGSSTKAVAGEDKDLYKVMLIDKLDNVMARDVQVNETIYNMLLQRLETAKITQRLQSSKEGTRYTVLDPPRIPLEPFYPNKILVAIMGLVLGLFVGVALVFLKEFLDNSFLDVQEAKEFLGVPLLGAISRIRTKDSIREEKIRQGWYTGLTLTSGILMVILAVFVTNLLK